MGRCAAPALAAKLSALEAELARLQAAQTKPAKATNVDRLLADIPMRARRAVDELERTLAAGDLVRAREELRVQVGVITVQADEREIRLLGEGGRVPPRCYVLLGPMQIALVAGDRSGS